MIEPLKIQIRFSDCDMMGHVNNACYLNYFEIARMHYFQQLISTNWDWKKNGIILKKNEIEYHLPLYLNENPIVIIRTEHIGQKSFTLAYELYVNEQLKTTGKSLIVSFDFNKNKTTLIPDELKLALSKLKNK
jgi:acyl-CoA thioester hydrolase